MLNKNLFIVLILLIIAFSSTNQFLRNLQDSEGNESFNDSEKYAIVSDPQQTTVVKESTDQTSGQYINIPSENKINTTVETDQSIKDTSVSLNNENNVSIFTSTDQPDTKITQELIDSNYVNNEETVELKDSFCMLNYKGKLFDLNPLKSDKDYRIQSALGNLTFNICQNQKLACNNKPELSMASYTTNNSVYDCRYVAGSNTVSNNYILNYNPKNNVYTIRMKLPEGDVCKTDITKRYTTDLEITCDAYQKEKDEKEKNENMYVPILENSQFNINSCENTIYIKSVYACPKYSVYSLFNNIISNRVLLGSILFCFGIFFCFVGENFIKITQVIAGTIFATGFIINMAFNSMIVEYNSIEFYTILIVAIGLGLIFGFYMTKVTWLPGLIFGTLLGFISGFLLFSFLITIFSAYPTFIFWSSILICVFIGCFVGYKKEEETAIISTTIIGAYSIVRAISIWVGNFPNEKQIYYLATNQEWTHLKSLISGIIYLYIFMLIIFSILGMIVQFKYFYHGANEEDKKKLINE